jgi:hypothetical protein
VVPKRPRLIFQRNKCSYLSAIAHGHKQSMCNFLLCSVTFSWNKQHYTALKLNSVALVRKWTIPTERPPLVGEVSANLYGLRIPTAVNLGFLDRSRYFFNQVAPQMSRGWVDPVLDPLIFRKSGKFGTRTRDLWICSQKLWPLDHRGSLHYTAVGR